MWDCGFPISWQIWQTAILHCYSTYAYRQKQQACTHTFNQGQRIRWQSAQKGDYVVYESTVYPGVTEDECVPVLEQVSGLKMNQDFL